MNTSFSYNPVTALAEADANGRTAEIFSDIRKTMGIPLLTSIWRGLASTSHLEDAWKAVKPIYESGLPQAFLVEFQQAAALSMNRIDKIPFTISTNDANSIHDILSVYNRSNTLNFIALSLFCDLNNKPRTLDVRCDNRLDKVTLRPLLSREQISDGIWALVRKVNAIGINEETDRVATLWRHLSYWPDLLNWLIAEFSTVGVDGGVNSKIKSTIELAQSLSAHIKSELNFNLPVPKEIYETITSYVTSPQQVARMVVMGNSIKSLLVEAEDV